MYHLMSRGLVLLFPGNILVSHSADSPWVQKPDFEQQQTDQGGSKFDR